MSVGGTEGHGSSGGVLEGRRPCFSAGEQLQGVVMVDGVRFRVLRALARL